MRPILATLVCLLFAAEAIAQKSEDWIEAVVPKNLGISGFTHGEYPAWGDNTHVGVDIGAACGAVVRAAADGYVVKSIDRVEDRDFNAVGYGLVVRHNEDLADGRPILSTYFHLESSPLVTSGPVQVGQELGFVGATGTGSGCHLHFEIRHFEGLRGLYLPTWRNIYGPGDRRNSIEFETAWTEPSVYFSNVSAGAETNEGDGEEPVQTGRDESWFYVEQIDSMTRRANGKWTALPAEATGIGDEAPTLVYACTDSRPGIWIDWGEPILWNRDSASATVRFKINDGPVWETQQRVDTQGVLTGMFSRPRYETSSLFLLPHIQDDIQAMSFDVRPKDGGEHIFLRFAVSADSPVFSFLRDCNPELFENLELSARKARGLPKLSTEGLDRNLVGLWSLDPVACDGYLTVTADPETPVTGMGSLGAYRFIARDWIDLLNVRTRADFFGGFTARWEETKNRWGHRSPYLFDATANGDKLSINHPDAFGGSNVLLHRCE